MELSSLVYCICSVTTKDIVSMILLKHTEHRKFTPMELIISLNVLNGTCSGLKSNNRIGQ